MTENSKVLALKYRPQVFEDLIGQEVIAETIKNSVITDKTAGIALNSDPVVSPQASRAKMHPTAPALTA